MRFCSAPSLLELSFTVCLRRLAEELVDNAAWGWRIGYAPLDVSFDAANGDLISVYCGWPALFQTERSIEGWLKRAMESYSISIQRRRSLLRVSASWMALPSVRRHPSIRKYATKRSAASSMPGKNLKIIYNS
jgi:hypothetical protein